MRGAVPFNRKGIWLNRNCLGVYSALWGNLRNKITGTAVFSQGGVAAAIQH